MLDVSIDVACYWFEYISNCVGIIEASSLPVLSPSYRYCFPPLRSGDKINLAAV